MKYMTSDDIRKTWLSFFKEKGHFQEASANLIPNNDPTLLWINSGVAALKKYFDGTERPSHRRITNAQKAIRTNDIDNVGHTARHHTFFEMLGNFSIGDYFRDEIIPWAVELLTSEKYFGFPKEKLFITYHPDDIESKKLWIKYGIDESHIFPLEGNFWEVGPGPSGPNTEIYFDRGEKYDPDGRGIAMLQNDEDNDRYIEIWNIVFSQYNAEPGVKPRSEYKELPQKNIDTGAGLERFACVIQETETNFETDLFLPYIKFIEKRSEFPYEGKYRYSYQVIADHIRSLTFALSDGAVFSNEGRGYVLKRLVRRLVRQATILKVDGKCLPLLVDEVANNMEAFYPYLQERKDRVKKMIESEVTKFLIVLNDGEKRIFEELSKCGDILPGSVAFTLSDTYGIPYDLTVELTEASGKSVDEKGYQEALAAQKEKARQARGDRKSFGQQSKDLIDFTRASDFTYDESEKIEATVIGLFKDGVKIDSLSDSGEVIFDRTDFYAESGGQIADIGSIRNDQTEADVIDVQKSPNKQHLHLIQIAFGSIHVGDKFILSPDLKRRDLIKMNHSSCHLLQKALQDCLGAEVHQQGSFVSDLELRFDFNYDGKISYSTLKNIELAVNTIILEGVKRETKVMDKEMALKDGAMALFGEKYEDKVRVVSFGDYSKEFCGGIHVDCTKDIGQFVITSCSAISAGVKRITGLTGIKAYKYRENQEEQLEEIAAALDLNSTKEIDCKLKANKNAHFALLERVEALEDKIAGLYLSNMLSNSILTDSIKIYSSIFEDLTHEQMLHIAKSIIALAEKTKDSAAVLLASKRKGKSEFVVALSSDLAGVKFKAGDIVKSLASILNGSGGGRPDVAFGGTNDLTNFEQAANGFKEIFKCKKTS